MAPHAELLDPADNQTVVICRDIFLQALSAEERDDRLDGGVGQITAVAFDGSRPVGFCMGTPTDTGVLDLDMVITDGAEDAAGDLWRVATSAAEGNSISLWGRPVRPYHRALAQSEGLTQTRELLQMRVDLPVQLTGLATQAFRPGIDNEAFVAVNNAAFAGHPEQGGWTLETLEAQTNADWFDPEGFRLFFDGDQLAGFCWTKIHRRSDGLDDLGEIYVIGLAPSHHGQGLGSAMTAAGLAWLHDQGLRVGMLYTEADNLPAVAAYQRLGFEVFATYGAWAPEAESEAIS